MRKHRAPTLHPTLKHLVSHSAASLSRYHSCIPARSRYACDALWPTLFDALWFLAIDASREFRFQHHAIRDTLQREWNGTAAPDENFKLLYASSRPSCYPHLYSYQSSGNPEHDEVGMHSALNWSADVFKKRVKNKASIPQPTPTPSRRPLQIYHHKQNLSAYHLLIFQSLLMVSTVVKGRRHGNRWRSPVTISTISKHEEDITVSPPCPGVS